MNSTLLIDSNNLTSVVFGSKIHFIHAEGPFQSTTLSNEYYTNVSTSHFVKIYDSAEITIQNVQMTQIANSCLETYKSYFDDIYIIFSLNNSDSLTVSNLTMSDSSLSYTNLFSLYEISQSSISSLSISNLSLSYKDIIIVQRCENITISASTVTSTSMTASNYKPMAFLKFFNIEEMIDASISLDINSLTFSSNSIYLVYLSKTVANTLSINLRSLTANSNSISSEGTISIVPSNSGTVSMSILDSAIVNNSYLTNSTSFLYIWTGWGRYGSNNH